MGTDNKKKDEKNSKGLDELLKKERYTKHPFADLLAAFISVILVTAILSAVLKGGPADLGTSDLKGFGASPGTAFCDSCESCSKALSEKGIERVFLIKLIATDSKECISIENQKGKVFDCQFNAIVGKNPETGIITIRGSEDIKITNCVIDKCGSGISLFDTSGSSIVNNKVRSCNEGITVVSGLSNQLVANTILDSEEKGIFITGLSFNNYLDRNTVSYGTKYGVKLAENTRTVISNSEMCQNKELDISNPEESNSFGDNNMCDRTLNWQDTGKEYGCTSDCRV